MSDRFVVVETVAMGANHVHQDDEGNVIQVTLPVVAGPFDELEDAEREAISMEYEIVAIPRRL